MDKGNAPPPGMRTLARAVRARARSLLAIEGASGAVLILATLVALAIANSRLSGLYDALWRAPVGFALGGHAFEHPLQFWVNDVLMTAFFFEVGLEIRREIFAGALDTLRRASVPVLAALGGMLVPAAVYFAFNAERAGAGGWAIPMSTDIAFALAALTLLGSRVPSALRPLLLAIAVIDDIGAIVVIAVTFSTGISVAGLGIALVGVLAIMALRAATVRSSLAYVLPGIAIWAGLFAAGVHPTLAGIAVGLLTPVRPAPDPAGRDEPSPSDQLLHALHPWVAFAVMPLFAFANAGVSIGNARFDGDARWVFVGIVLGLVVGKPLGIVGTALLSRAAGLAATPSARGLGLVGLLGGIGFTMSLFIAHLAFPAGDLLDTAKLAILVGSGLASLGGVGYGIVALRRESS